MATWYSDQFDSTNRAEDRVVGKTLDSSVKMAKATYTMTGSEAAAEYVALFKLPAGSEIIHTGSYVKSISTVGATATLDIGDDDNTGDVDRYLDGADIAAVGTDDFTLRPNYVLTEEATIKATFATLTTPSAGGQFAVYIAYRQNS